MSQEPILIPIDQARAPIVPSTSIKAFVSLAMAHTLVDCSSTVWPMFKNLAELDLAQAGMIATIAVVIPPAMQPIFGLMADHGYRQRLLLIGPLLVCSIVLLGPISRHPEFMHSGWGHLAMLAVLLVVMFGNSLFHPSGMSAASSIDPARRSTLLAVFIACGWLGFAMSHKLFSAVYVRLDQYTEVLLIPGLAVVALALWWCRIPTPRRPGPLGVAQMYRQIVAMPLGVLPLWGTQVLITAVTMSLAFLLPELVEQHGYNKWWVNGGAFGLYIIGAAVTMVPVVHLADRFSRKLVMLVCLILAIPVYFALVTLTAPPLALFMALLIAMGALAGSTSTIIISHGQYLVAANPSLISGVLLGLAWAGASPGTWITGSLAKRPHLGISGALAWMGIALLLAVILACLVPQKGPREEGPRA